MRKVYKKKMLDSTTSEQVYNPEKYQIMNARSLLL